ncbi:hypothetical protein HYH03_005949 [Edaphochlamys debaryana]|uniref:Folate receptor-like domain-containing protein n=1 Tax=Edaphochlamys debaryana TaxID=47281 RepID=A0A835Y6K9_9CHLO|nr:hypothetical protein HYH03_005949 [Edaphochlamys debaryana]|eukprot:KAG2496027.1 hypothetical protein HYH03_005949 [Edaphochlamys debaryana]
MIQDQLDAAGKSRRGAMRTSLPLLLAVWTLAVRAQNDLTCKPQEGLPLSQPYPPAYFVPGGLPVCSQFTCSCCNRTHALAVARALRSAAEDPGFPRACLAWQTRMACRVCDPEVGVGLKPTVCRSACDAWLSACASSYFSSSLLTSPYDTHLPLPCAIRPDAEDEGEGGEEGAGAGADEAGARNGTGAGGGGGGGGGGGAKAALAGPLLCYRLGDWALDGAELCRKAGLRVSGAPAVAAGSKAKVGAGHPGPTPAPAPAPASGDRHRSGLRAASQLLQRLQRAHGAAAEAAGDEAAAGDDVAGLGLEEEAEEEACYDGLPGPSAPAAGSKSAARKGGAAAVPPHRTDFCVAAPPPARRDKGRGGGAGAGAGAAGAGEEAEAVGPAVWLVGLVVVGSLLWLGTTQGLAARQQAIIRDHDRARQLHWRQMQGRHD